jgi:23S rRNA (uracil-5-)-methyltransferase RumA
VLTHTLHGDSHLAMALGGLRFRVSSASFFQVNPSRAEALLAAVARAAALSGGETLLDLFCGTGALGLCLASRARELHGWEASASAVADARANAAANGIRHATFHAGDLAKLGGAIGASVPKPDVVVVDPARAGLAPPLAAFLRRCSAARVVYVSCNPATQARDVKALCAAAAPGSPERPYRLRWVQPVDMFPHTAHIEAVALLTHDG